MGTTQQATPSTQLDQANLLRPSGEIDVFTLFYVLGTRWIALAIGAGIGVLAAALYLHSATFSYTARMDVSPAQGLTESLGSRAGGLGGLAAMAGIRLDNSQEGQNFQLYVEGLHARDVADQLARHADIMQVLFNANWDATSQRWLPPQKSIWSTLKSWLRALLGLPSLKWHAPGGAEVHQYLLDSVRIEQSTKTPVVKVTLDHRDPRFAEHFLNVLNQEVDRKLRRRTLERTGEYIEFLTQKLPTVTVAEHRMALAQTLSEQEKLRIMASSSIPFAADVFDGPAATAYPTKPKPVLVLIAGFLGGALIAALAVLGHLHLRRPADDESAAGIDQPLRASSNSAQ